MALLVQNLERLDEIVKEEADGVHNTLGTIENMTELKPEICVSAGEQGLIAWLLKRLRVRLQKICCRYVETRRKTLKNVLKRNPSFGPICFEPVIRELSLFS